MISWPRDLAAKGESPCNSAANEFIVGLAVAEKGEPKEEATNDAPFRMQPLGIVREFGQAQAGRRRFQTGAGNAVRIVLVAEEMRVGVDDAVRQEGEDLPFEKLLIFLFELVRKHGSYPVAYFLWEGSSQDVVLADLAAEGFLLEI